MTPTNKITVLTTMLLVIGSAIALPALGQQDGRNHSLEAARERALRAARERDLQNRSSRLRMLEKEARRPVERRAPRLAVAQIREDFMRIQIANNELKLTAFRAEALDLKLVGKWASELKKLAGRLNFNLALPEPEKVTKRPPAEAEQLRQSIATLDGLIIGFVNNPIFKETNVIDAQLSGKARRTLEEIIELSGQVKKSSEKLRKAVQKPQ